MSIKAQIEQDSKQALRQREKTVVSALRLLLAVIKNKEIALRPKELTDEDTQSIVTQEIKKRKDSISDYQKGNRGDLVLQEEKEIEIITKYLPKQLSEEEIRDIVQKKIKDLGEVGEKDFGRVMKEAMGELKGKAGGDAVSRIVRECLKAEN